MIAFLSSSDKKKLLAEIEARFGIELRDYLFLQAGKERVRAFSGTLSREELLSLSEFARVEFAGAYLARQESFGLRLAFDMTHVLSSRFTKGVIELSSEEFELWMRGETLVRELEAGVYVVRYGEDFLGSGYASHGKLYNYVPKERHLKKR